MKILISFLFCCFIVIANAQQSDSLEVIETLQEIYAMKIANNTIQEFDEKHDIKYFNDSTDYRGIATVYIWKKEYDLAIEKINEEIKVNPQNADAYNLRGLARSRKGEQETAISDFNTAISLCDTISNYYYNMGVAYDEMKNVELALLGYLKATSLDENNFKAHFNAGVTLFSKKDFQTAHTHLTRAFYLNPNNEKIILQLALCNIELKEYGIAETLLKRALHFNSENIPALLSMMKIYYKKQDVANSCKWMYKAKDAGYEFPQAVLDSCTEYK